MGFKSIASLMYDFFGEKFSNNVLKIQKTQDLITELRMLFK